MRIVYLINQYPKVSHSFIRREIRALETQGLTIDRVAIRSSDEVLVDPEDQREHKQTFVLLAGGLHGLVLVSLRLAVSRPVSMLRAARLALKLSRRAPGSFWKNLAYLAEAAALFGRFSSSDVAHVHAHFGTNSATVALLWNSLGGPPFSMTVHGPEEFDRPETLGLDVKIEAARFVIAVSQFGRSQLMRWCDHSQWKKLHVVHCGLDDRFLKAAPTTIPENQRLVCVGRLCEQKGHGLLIEAADRLAGDGVDFELVLVGDGPLRHEIEAQIQSRGLQDRVRITGWKSGEGVADEMRAARALVLPSFAEGLPVVIMEALAMGRPVISTYVAGIPELVVPGECGWLVPAGAVEPLCEAIRSVLESSASQISEMGRLGSVRVLKEHCALTEAAKLVVIFRKYEQKDPNDEAG